MADLAGSSHKFISCIEKSMDLFLFGQKNPWIFRAKVVVCLFFNRGQPRRRGAKGPRRNVVYGASGDDLPDCDAGLD